MFLELLSFADELEEEPSIVLEATGSAVLEVEVEASIVDIFKSISKADPVFGDVDLPEMGSLVDEAITHLGLLSVVLSAVLSLVVSLRSSSFAGNIHGLGCFDVSV